jgi:hypothetical protein
MGEEKQQPNRCKTYRCRGHVNGELNTLLEDRRLLDVVEIALGVKVNALLEESRPTVNNLVDNGLDSTLKHRKVL